MNNSSLQPRTKYVTSPAGDLTFQTYYENTQGPNALPKTSLAIPKQTALKQEPSDRIYNKHLSDDFRQFIGVQNLDVWPEQSPLESQQAFEAFVEFYAVQIWREKKQSLLDLLPQNARLRQIQTGEVEWDYNGQHGKGIISLLTLVHNLSRLDATNSLAQVLGIKNEFCFNTFPRAEALTAEKAGQLRSTPQVCLSHSFTINDHTWRLQNRHDIFGYGSQLVGAILVYEYSTKRIYLPATVFRGVLCIGHTAAPGYLYNRHLIEQNPRAVILFFQDISSALDCDALVKESTALTDAQVIVTGHLGGYKALDCLDAGELYGRDVIIVLAPDRTYHGQTERYVELCQNNHAQSVRVYRAPVLAFKPDRADIAPETLSDPWERYLAENATYLANVENFSTLVAKICAGAVGFEEFRCWGYSVGLFIREQTAKASEKANLSFCTPAEIVDAYPSEGYLENISLGETLQPNDVSILHGPPDLGKSLCIKEMAKSIGTGDECFCFTAGPPKSVFLLDAETPPRAFEFRIKQLGLDKVQNLWVVCLKMRPAGWDDFDFKLKECQEKLVQLLADKKIAIVILDNITKLCGYGDANNAKSIGYVWDFIDLCGKHNIAVLLVHHSNDNDEMPGTKDFVRRCQNIFRLSAVDREERGVPEKDALFRLKATKCKACDALKEQAAVYHLPAGSAVWEELPDNPKSSNSPKKPDNQNSAPEMPFSCVETMVADEDATYANDTQEPQSEPECPAIMPSDPLDDDGFVRPDTADTAKLTKNEKSVLDLLRDDPEDAGMTREMIQKALVWEKDKTNKILTALKDKKLLDKLGGGSSFYWRLRK